MRDSRKEYVRLTLEGLVQGVGFRPYTANLCKGLNIDGFVKNTGGAVMILACAANEELGGLMSRLSCITGDLSDLPKACVKHIKKEVISEEEFQAEYGRESGFYIKESDDGGGISIVTPDIATCIRCRAELFDTGNRRYMHPFISCVSCGPRFSVMERIPYDRENTSMKEFALCEECGTEYAESMFRRYAQTIACKSCGPVLSAYIPDKNGEPVKAAEGGAAMKLALKGIKDGRIVAVKNTGGYHLVLDALNNEAAARLREKKQRENKPFAVMFKSMEEIREYCITNEAEEELLDSDIKPIVLLKKRKDGKKTAGQVSMKSSRIGAMLACDPVQLILLSGISPLVMTSANKKGEPITGDDEEALYFLREGIADIVLSNDRRIVYPSDDSIFQVVKVKDRYIKQVIRRARGMVPEPVEIKREIKEDIFAAGGDLKSVFGYGRGNAVVLSGHYGDLDDIRALEQRNQGIEHFKNFFGFSPKIYAMDMHPGYVSGRTLFRENADKKDSEKTTVRVQHHHAHILSVAAECGMEGRFIGAALDGTGFGEDGNIWGSEILICDSEKPREFIRAGHFFEVKLTGGDSISKDADKAAMCYISCAEERKMLHAKENPYRDKESFNIIKKAVKAGINTHISTSAGRLFDSVCAILGICKKNSYEGECPVLLMQAAEEYEDMAAPETAARFLKADIICTDGVYIADTVKLVADIVKEKNRGRDINLLAYAFHYSLADVIYRMIERLREDTGSDRAALSGGTFNNGLLLRMLYDRLITAGFKVYVNEKVPAGDGGLALGQIYSCHL